MTSLPALLVLASLTLVDAVMTDTTRPRAQAGGFLASAEPSWWTMAIVARSPFATAEPNAEPASGWTIIDPIEPDVVAEPEP